MEVQNRDLILANIEPDELGKNLVGFGVNLICPEHLIYAPSIARVFSLNLIRVDEFYALLTWDDNANFGNLIQVHSDFSYKKLPTTNILMTADHVAWAQSFVCLM